MWDKYFYYFNINYILKYSLYSPWENPDWYNWDKKRNEKNISISRSNGIFSSNTIVSSLFFPLSLLNNCDVMLNQAGKWKAQLYMLRETCQLHVYLASTEDKVSKTMTMTVTWGDCPSGFRIVAVEVLTADNRQILGDLASGFCQVSSFRGKVMMMEKDLTFSRLLVSNFGGSWMFIVGKSTVFLVSRKTKL